MLQNLTFVLTLFSCSEVDKVSLLISYIISSSKWIM